jgi:hypothetical protein
MQMSSKFDFCPVLKELLLTRKAVGRTGQTFDNLVALSTNNNLSSLRELMLQFKPENTLEIGLAFAGSCLAIAASHQDLEHQPAKQHVTIDPCQSTVWDDVGRIAIEKSNLIDYVDIREDFSYSALPKLLSEGKIFDLIYIDGSHLFENVFIDFFYSNQLLSENGILLFDDSSHADVRKVLNFIDSNFSSSYQKLNLAYIYSGVGLFKYRLASFLRRNQLTAYQKVGKTNRFWDEKLCNF